MATDSLNGGLPETVRIGPVAYRICQVHDLMGTDDGGKSIWLNGRCRYTSARIELCDELGEQVKPVGLMHEVLHGILEQAGVKEQPEDVIIALGYGLVALLRDNPELVDYLRASAPVGST